jgi:hypothetical protein
VEGRQPTLDLLGEDRPVSPLLRLAGPLTALLLLVTAGCSSSDGEKAAPEPGSGASPSASTTASTAPPVVPRVGECHQLTLDQATDPVDPTAPVPCRQPHTSVTFKVGRLTPLADGHLLAVDSRTVRAQIAKACPDSPGAFVGGDSTAQRLSKFEVVWFGPSLEQADAGANWYRCDVVAVRTEGQLLDLPARLRGLLDQRGALDRFGTCGTTAPDKPGFDRVVCSERHTWRAVDVVELPKNAGYVAKELATTGDDACKVIATDLANGDLKRTWSFERPTRAQWAAGQRYGYCWVPQS